MKADALLDQAGLAPAIERLGAALKAQPDDLASRRSLFELLCFSGDLARAEKQLDVLAHRDPTPAAQLGLQVYRNLLEAEKGRARLFSDGVRPRFMFTPPPATALHLEALELLRAGRRAEARDALDRAAALRKPPRGRAGGVAFEGFRDADDLLAPVLEVFAPTGYCWVSWEEIQYLEVPPPKNLRDLLWAPAKIASFDGQLGEVFLPNLYPGSSAHPDDLVRLGRKTDWQDAGDGIVRGLGQKLFLAGDDARTLIELGEVQFSADADGRAEAPPAADPGSGSE